MAEHYRFGLDPAHAPAHHAQSVDHGGVGVGAHYRIREGLPTIGGFAHAHHRRQGFQIDLVHNAYSRWRDAQVLELALSPAKELVSLSVTLVLQVHVEVEGVGPAGIVHVQRVIDHQDHRDQRIDHAGVQARSGHG